ncbi:hypothetical protein BMI87_10060, partial [Thioclava sp. F28-4]
MRPHIVVQLAGAPPLRIFASIARFVIRSAREARKDRVTNAVDMKTLLRVADIGVKRSERPRSAFPAWEQ